LAEKEDEAKRLKRALEVAANEVDKDDDGKVVKLSDLKNLLERFDAKRNLAKDPEPAEFQLSPVGFRTAPWAAAVVI